jgi:uncharacterized membrane protein
MLVCPVIPTSDLQLPLAGMLSTNAYYQDSLNKSSNSQAFGNPMVAVFVFIFWTEENIFLRAHNSNFVSGRAFLLMMGVITYYYKSWNYLFAMSCNFWGLSIY